MIGGGVPTAPGSAGKPNPAPGHPTVPAGAIRAGFAAVRRSKRLLLLSALRTAVLSLPVALYVGREVHALAARRPDAKSIAVAFDPDFWADLRLLNPAFDASVTTLVAASILLYLLTLPFVWGGYCGIAATTRRLPFATFMREAGANYWKFLRIAAIGGAVLFAVAVAMKPFLDLVEKWAKSEVSETIGERYRASGQYAALGSLLVVKLVLDHAKVGVRLHRRPGVLRELARSALFVLQHPRTLVAFTVARVVDVAAIAVFGVFLRIADGAYVTTTIGVAVLATLLVAVREATSLFHIAAAWQIRAVEDAPPPPPPDVPDGEPDILTVPLPWRDT